MPYYPKSEADNGSMPNFKYANKCGVVRRLEEKVRKHVGSEKLAIYLDDEAKARLKLPFARGDKSWARPVFKGTGLQLFPWIHTGPEDLRAADFQAELTERYYHYSEDKIASQYLSDTQRFFSPPMNTVSRSGYVGLPTTTYSVDNRVDKGMLTPNVEHPERQALIESVITSASLLYTNPVHAPLAINKDSTSALPYGEHGDIDARVAGMRNIIDNSEDFRELFEDADYYSLARDFGCTFAYISGMRLQPDKVTDFKFDQKGHLEYAKTKPRRAPTLTKGPVDVDKSTNDPRFSAMRSRTVSALSSETNVAVRMAIQPYLVGAAEAFPESLHQRGVKNSNSVVMSKGYAQVVASDKPNADIGIDYELLVIAIEALPIEPWIRDYIHETLRAVFVYRQTGSGEFKQFAMVGDISSPLAGILDRFYGLPSGHGFTPLLNKTAYLGEMVFITWYTGKKYGVQHPSHVPYWFNVFKARGDFLIGNHGDDNAVHFPDSDLGEAHQASLIDYLQRCENDPSVFPGTGMGIEPPSLVGMNVLRHDDEEVQQLGRRLSYTSNLSSFLNNFCKEQPIPLEDVLVFNKTIFKKLADAKAREMGYSPDPFREYSPSDFSRLKKNSKVDDLKGAKKNLHSPENEKLSLSEKDTDDVINRMSKSNDRWGWMIGWLEMPNVYGDHGNYFRDMVDIADEVNKKYYGFTITEVAEYFLPMRLAQFEQMANVEEGAFQNLNSHELQVWTKPHLLHFKYLPGDDRIRPEIRERFQQTVPWEVYEPFFEQVSYFPAVDGHDSPLPEHEHLERAEQLRESLRSQLIN